MKILKNSTQAHFFVLCILAFFTTLSCQSSPNKEDDNKEVEKKKVAPQPEIKKGSISIGNKTYQTLSINGLRWLAENLDIELKESWCYGSDPAQCQKQGRHYRWEGAKKACASLGEGWRLPSEGEWQQLALVHGGYIDWLTEEETGDAITANRALIKGGSSGFDFPLGGWRGSNGGFDSQGKMGFYWTSTAENEDNAWFYIVMPEGGKLTRRSTTKRMGMGCRCVNYSRKS